MSAAAAQDLSLISVYDHRLNRRLTDDDLPDGIDLVMMAAFLKAQNVQFFSIESFDPQRKDVVWERSPDIFRVGTYEFPQRGINVRYEVVLKWADEAIENGRVTRAIQFTTEQVLPGMKDMLAGAGMTRSAALVDELRAQIAAETTYWDQGPGR